jgi:hypothetical protein
MTDFSAISDEVPWSHHLTDYDKAHSLLYLRLLDATSAGASDDEICSVLLGIDATWDLERARRCLRSHLSRAQWVSAKGYRDLLI